MHKKKVQIFAKTPPSLFLKNSHFQNSHSKDLKHDLVWKNLQKYYTKFSRSVDLPYKELDRIYANSEDDFVDQRSAQHLAKIAFFIHFIRKKLNRDNAIFPLKEHYDIRLFPTFLQFTFGSKPVLGILAHLNLRSRYEVFDEEHILLLIQKKISDVQLIKGSVYTFQSLKNTVKTLYFEIDKKSGFPFSCEEVTLIKKLLNQEIKFCVEKLVPQVFIARNEEEVLRNILTLNQEIQKPSDIPQIMIQFDQQSSLEVTFTVIVVRVCKKGEISIWESFAKMQKDYTCTQDRFQIVRYLEEKHQIEASVLKINIAKDFSFQRSDQSLNFYLARQKVSQILVNMLGEFRDFNGGLILKQRESLIAVKEELALTSMQDSDLLETFFYSLSPIEYQAILSSSSIKKLFCLFSESLRSTISKPFDFSFNFHFQGSDLFLMIRIPDYSLNDVIREILTSHKLNQDQFVSSFVPLDGTFFLGFLITALERSMQAKLIEDIDNALKEWSMKVESRQVLKLGLASSVVSLDPRIGGDQISPVLLNLLFEGLMRENKNGEIDYGIAHRVEISDDLKTYIFHLRKCSWSNGSLVTALDFEYAWKKVLSPTFKTPFAYFFYPIKNAKLAKEGLVSEDMIGVKAIDESTLKVDLEVPTPYFLELTANTLYSPVNRLIDEIHPYWPYEDKDRFVCNGAFQLIKNDPSSGYELLKNPSYWDVENIQLDQVLFIKANRYQSYEMFQNNDNHWIGTSLGTLDPSFIPHEEDEELTFFNNLVYWVVFNTTQFPFNNKKFRKALAIGIDRSTLSKLFDLRPAFTILPPLHAQIKNSILSEYDIEKARAMFDEALQELRISVQNLPVFHLIYHAGFIRNKIAEFIKGSWEETFGIKCKVEPLEWDVLFSRMTEGNFTVGGMGWQPLIDDPIYTLNAFKEAKELTNFASWESRNFQDILHLAQGEISSKQRRKYYLQAEEILLDELPVIPINFNVSKALKKKNLSMEFFSSLLNFKWAHLELPK